MFFNKDYGSINSRLSFCLFVFAFIVVVFAGMHGVVEIITNRLLQGIPFSEVMFLVAGMAGDTVKAFRHCGSTEVVNAPGCPITYEFVFVVS